MNEATTADSLRALADLFDEHPELAPGTSTIFHHVRDGDPAALREQFRSAVDALGEHNDNQFAGSDYITARRSFGNGVELIVSLKRSLLASPLPADLPSTVAELLAS